MRQRVEDALCPRCGTTKPPRADECPNCGVIYVKYEATVRRRQLDTKPAPAPAGGCDWNRLPLYAGITIVLVLLWHADALWRRGFAAVDEATRINSTATGGAPLAVITFSCRPAQAGTVVIAGEVQNRTQRAIALDVDVAYVDRADGIDKTRHARAELEPETLPPLVVGHFEVAVPRSPKQISECRISGLSERGGAPLAFDGVHG